MKETTKDKILDILDKALRVFLVISFVFGTLQFLLLAVLALFGIYIDWQQYVASLVLLGVGIVGFKFFINLIED